MIKSVQITLVLLLSFVQGYGQQIEDYQVPALNWSKWDAYQNDDKLKEAFLAPLKVQNQPLKIDSLLYFKVVDVDGLNELDIIKSMGPDSAGTIIYINAPSGLQEVYNQAETIVSISRDTPISAISFQTVVIDNEEQVFEVKFLSPALIDNSLAYRNMRTESIHQGTKDIYRNMPPTYFRIKNGNTPLLEGPGLDYLVRTCGPSDVGYALGSFKTKSGDVWWKVFMLEQNYTFTLGWLKRTDVLSGYQK